MGELGLKDGLALRSRWLLLWSWMKRRKGKRWGRWESSILKVIAVIDVAARSLATSSNHKRDLMRDQLPRCRLLLTPSRTHRIGKVDSVRDHHKSLAKCVSTYKSAARPPSTTRSLLLSLFIYQPPHPRIPNSATHPTSIHHIRHHLDSKSEINKNRKNASKDQHRS